VQMPTIIVKVDLECCRCYTKIQKVLTRIQGTCPAAKSV
jgi:hypothetical protein